ncbi:hypothetical protein D3C81_1765520 [compost metagenome]
MPVAFKRMYHPAMPVIREFAQAGVGNDQQIRIPRFNDPCRFLYDTVLRESRGAHAILRFWNTEQQHRRNAQINDLLHFFLQGVERKMINPGHRRYLALDATSVGDENGLDKVVHRQDGFSYHAANGGRLTQPAMSYDWKTHV